jgi:hypothetical protein
MCTDGQRTWNLNQCFEHKGELGELSDDVTDSDDESDLKQSKEADVSKTGGPAVRSVIL